MASVHLVVLIISCDAKWLSLLSGTIISDVGNMSAISIIRLVLSGTSLRGIYFHDVSTYIISS